MLGHGFAIGAASLPYAWYDAGTEDLEAGGRFAVAMMMVIMFAVGQTIALGSALLASYGLGIPRFRLGLIAGWAAGMVPIIGATVVL